MKKFIFSISAVSMAILTACSGNNAAAPIDETDALSDLTTVAETTGVSMADNGNNENSDSYTDHDMKALKEKFPEYFDLGTFKGLEIYVWQMAEGQYSFGIMQGTNRNKTDKELMDLKGATTEEMRAILSTYEIDKDDIFIIPWQNPISSYIPDYLIEEGMGDSAATRKDQYIEQIRSLLFDDISEEVYTVSHTVSDELTAAEIYYETWPSVPENNWGINPFRPVDTTTTAPIDTTPTENTDEYDIQIMQLTGYYFHCNNGADMFVSDNMYMKGPIVLYKYDMSGFSDGDQIRVDTYSVEESYPMGCYPEKVELIEKSGIHPIPKTVIDYLATVEEMGYYTSVTENAEININADVETILASLDYSPYTCDGLPEYKITTDDGVAYFLNISEKWVWKEDTGYEAVLTDEIISIIRSQWDTLEVSELNANTDDVSADKAINVIWSRTYGWAMGGDYVYIDSDGKIYEEHEMEEPMFSPLGACNETYSGKQFTEEELDEFLSINKDDEELQKKILSRKGIKFGKL